MRKARLLATVLLFFISMAACSTSRTLINTEERIVPDRLDGMRQTKKTVRRGIIAGCIEKGWKCRKVGAGLIEGSLKIRRHVAVVLITYDATSYGITYKSSENLDYNNKRNTIHKSYNHWINNLDNTIGKQLSIGLRKN